MRFLLTTSEAKASGVFGTLVGEGRSLQTLEHAYPVGSWWEPKVARGRVYACVRHVPNRLPYETFMLKDVPDFQGQPVQGILIHCGNFDKDSEGCILVGIGRENDAITQSKAAFKQLMELLKDVSEFELEIK